MRSEFEKLPEIAKIIKEHDAFYCNKGEWYLCPDDDQFAEAYLDGAWYAHQEQQKRINAIKQEMKLHLEDDYDGLERPDYDAMLYLLRDIKELLK